MHRRDRQDERGRDRCRACLTIKRSPLSLSSEGILQFRPEAYRAEATEVSFSPTLNAMTAQLVAAAEIQESFPCGKPLWIVVGWNGKARRRTCQVPSSSW